MFRGIGQYFGITKAPTASENPKKDKKKKDKKVKKAKKDKDDKKNDKDKEVKEVKENKKRHQSVDGGGPNNALDSYLSGDGSGSSRQSS